MGLPLFLSRRILGVGGSGVGVSRPAIRIATAGVAIGIAVMLLSVSIVIGFKGEIRDKLIGFGGSVEVASAQALYTGEQYPVVLSEALLDELRAVPGVRHIEPYCMAQGLLKTDDEFLGVTFKGESEQWDTTFIHSHLVCGTLPVFSAERSSNQIVISSTIARKLYLSVGDRVYAYFFDGSSVRTRRFTIAAIYETNLSQYDDVVCFTDLHTAVRLNGWAADAVAGAEVYIDDFSQLDEVAWAIAERVDSVTDSHGRHLSSRTIRERSPQLFAWLDLLDMNVWIILVLMLVVAVVTMVSGLLIIILERTAMIGTLKALGARNGVIQRTFLWFGIFIIGRGLLIGDVIAIVLLLLQRWWGIIRLDPATYYVSEVPVDFNIPLFLLLNVATIVISGAMLLLPSILIAHIRPAKAIRFA